MTRYLCWVAVLGVIALPDWASACRPGRGNRVAYHQQAYPVYHTYPVYPAYSACEPPVYVYPPVYQQATGGTFPPPRIEPSPRMAAPSPAPPPGVGTVPPSVTQVPRVETVRPIAGSDIATPPTSPTPPTPKKADPPLVGAEPLTLPKFPVVEIPKNLEPLPKLDVPKEPNFQPIPTPMGPTTEPPKTPGALILPEPVAGFTLPDPKSRTTEQPKNPSPKLPAMPAIPGASPGDSAVPSPAPAMPDLFIPPQGIPAMPDIKKPDGLPSLTLPPPSDSVSKSSPVASNKPGMTVSVFTASGTEKAADGYRTVGFYNHTSNDLSLTIEGRAVKLPAKMYLHAKLGPTFTWSHSDRPVTRESVPERAAGLDVVFRPGE